LIGAFFMCSNAIKQGLKFDLGYTKASISKPASSTALMITDLSRLSPSTVKIFSATEVSTSHFIPSISFRNPLTERIQLAQLRLVLNFNIIVLND
jgi:hypothetical protein